MIKNIVKRNGQIEAFDPNKVNVSLDRGGDMSTLAIEIEMPGPAAATIVPTRRAAAR